MIQIKNLCKGFGNKELFNNFNLDINNGEFIVFAGKSGCGKTTLLNMIGALERPDKGEILVNNRNIYLRKNQTKYFCETVGFLFQNFALSENETVLENLNYVQKKYRSEKTMDEILYYIGMEDQKNTKVYKLSGGEQQRIALARLMYKKCSIILADEPTGSLDTENAENVLKILHDLNKSGKTVILVTHDEKIIKKEKKVIHL